MNTQQLRGRHWRTGSMSLWLVSVWMAVLPGRPAAQDCPAVVYQEAVQLQIEAVAAEKALDNDKRKPPKDTWSRDYEEEVETWSNLEKAGRKAIAQSKKNLAEAQKALDDEIAYHPKFEPIEIPADTSAEQAQVKLSESLTELRNRVASGAEWRQRFAKDEVIAEANRALVTEQKALEEKTARFMPPGTPPDEILARINDTSFRGHDPNTGADNDHVARLAAKLLEYQNFGDRQEVPDVNGLTLRRRVQEAFAATGEAVLHGRNPWDELRTLGPQLIAEIERCRLEVHLANKPVMARKETIKQRMTAIDPDAALEVEMIDELNRRIELGEAKLVTLSVQRALEKHRYLIDTCKRMCAADAERLATVLTELNAARAALAAYKAWSDLVGTAMKKRQAAEAAVIATKATMDKDETDQAAAQKKAEADYLAIEKELTDFKTSVTEKKKKIDAETVNDQDARRSRTAKLRIEVKAKKDEAIVKLEAIKATLEAFRRCHTKVDELAKKIAQKTFALGGPAGASGDGFAADLLDVPLDEPATPTATGSVWVCEEPIVGVVGENPKVSRSASGFSVKQEWNGKQLSGNVSWTGPKGELKEGQDVELTINASGDAAVYGWFNVNCAGEYSVSDNNAASLPEGKRTGPVHGSGRLVFKFKPSSDPYIQVQAGQEPGSTRWVSVTWKFKKKA